MTTWSIINGHLVFDTWKVNAIWLSRNMEAINIEAKKVNMSWHYFHDTTNFWLGNSCRIHHSINSSITSFCRAPGGSGETCFIFLKIKVGDGIVISNSFLVFWLLVHGKQVCQHLFSQRHLLHCYMESIQF